MYGRAELHVSTEWSRLYVNVIASAKDLQICQNFILCAIDRLEPLCTEPCTLGLKKRREHSHQTRLRSKPVMNARSKRDINVKTKPKRVYTSL